MPRDLSFGDILGGSAWKKKILPSVLNVALGGLISIVTGTLYGLMPAIMTALLSLQGKMLRGLQIGLGVAFTWSLLMTLFGNKSEFAHDNLAFFAASLCIAVTLEVMGLSRVSPKFSGRNEPKAINRRGAVVHWNGADISYRVVDQEQLALARENLARTSQITALSELTAYISHDVGQPLASIVSSADSSQRWLSIDPPNVERALKALDRVVRSAETTRAIFDQARALFKNDADTRQLCSLEAVLRSAAELIIEDQIVTKPALFITFEPDLPDMTLHRGQLTQVFVSLIKIGLETGRANAGQVKLSIDVRGYGNKVTVRVGNDGAAFSTDNIFQPFRSGKANGIEMDLAVCKSIIEAHGGRIWVEKTEPEGAAFVFTLPNA